MSGFAFTPGSGPDNGKHIGVVVVDDEPDFARGLARLVASRFAEAQVEAARFALATLAHNLAPILRPLLAVAVALMPLPILRTALLVAVAAAFPPWVSTHFCALAWVRL